MNPYNTRPSALARATAALLHTVLAVFAALVMIGALLLGLAVAAGVVAWALLRGRRPGPVNLRWRAGPVPRDATTRQATGEVVDAVVVREIEPPSPR